MRHCDLPLSRSCWNLALRTYRKQWWWTKFKICLLSFSKERWRNSYWTFLKFQSDREKEQGLPVAPFMDREKVTKPTAQIGFIKFVLVPMFETVAKVLSLRKWDAAIGDIFWNTYQSRVVFQTIKTYPSSAAIVPPDRPNTSRIVRSSALSVSIYCRSLSIGLQA